MYPCDSACKRYRCEGGGLETHGYWGRWQSESACPPRRVSTPHVSTGSSCEPAEARGPGELSARKKNPSKLVANLLALFRTLNGTQRRTVATQRRKHYASMDSSILARPGRVRMHRGNRPA